jgi:hypothetical protein
MPRCEQDPETGLATRAADHGQPWAVTEAALAELGPLRVALGAYERSGDTVYLDAAFAAARALLDALPWFGRHPRPDLGELRWVAQTVPEFAQLLSIAAGEAERAIAASLMAPWQALGLRSPPPGWIASELESAEMLFACTCAATDPTPAERVPAGLRRLAAGRLALQLTGELGRDEQLWQRALGRRYDSVRHRYARRTTWRSRGLAELVRDDESTRRAVSARLGRWLADGGRLAALAGELEAALVHERTPSRFA